MSAPGPSQAVDPSFAAGPVNTVEDGLKIWSCIVCRRRKVRCDRKDPCQNCTKAGIECHFPVTGRLPRRSRDPTGTTAKTPTQKQLELMSRIRRLEALVIELGCQIHANDDVHENSTNSGSIRPVRPDERIGSTVLNAASGSGMISQVDNELGEDFGQLVVGKDGSIHIGKEFWSVFCTEVNEIFQGVEETGERAEPSLVQGMEALHLANNGDAFAFGDRLGLGLPYELFPSRSSIKLLWAVFQQRMDPFVKVLHKPTISHQLQDLPEDLSTILDQDLKTIIFAISLGAIASLTNGEVLEQFNETKAKLISKYRLGAEQSLAQARFLTTDRIPVLQAFTIYVFVLPLLPDGRKLAWSLTGVLMRVATAAMLHRDPCPDEATAFTPSPGKDLESRLDVEIHRRLWLQICLLESRNRPQQAPTFSISPEDTNVKLPGNLDDDKLAVSVGMRIAEQSMYTSCDMGVMLLRHEFYKLSKSLHAQIKAGIPSLLQTFYTAQLRIQDQILHHLILTDPLEGFIRSLSDMFFANIELVILTRSVKFPQLKDMTRIEAELALVPSMSLLQAYLKLTCTPTWKIWSCHLMGAEPLRALCIVLGQIKAREWKTEVSEFWDCAKQVTQSIQTSMPARGVNRQWDLIQKLCDEISRRAELNKPFIQFSRATIDGSASFGDTGSLPAESVLGPETNAPTSFVPGGMGLSYHQNAAMLQPTVGFMDDGDPAAMGQYHVGDFWPVDDSSSSFTWFDANILGDGMMDWQNWDSRGDGNPPV